MTISRWKVMAGVLGVSLGGLAAIAGQCPRSDGTQTQRSDDAPLTVEAPRVPPAGAGTKPTPPPLAELPAPTGGVALPTLPTGASEPVKLPDVPPPGVGATLPQVNLPKAEATKQPEMTPLPVTTTPTIIPASGTLPMMPKVQEPTLPQPGPQIPDSKPLVQPTGPTITPPAPTTTPTAPTANSVPPIEFTRPSGPATQPAILPESGPGTPSRDPLLAPPAPMVNNSADVRIPPTPQPVSTNAAPPVTASATKFRILLRVGEGEPSFEVRSGDDLLMKVVCEKVDIKSPEKGQSLSAVTASGKVRFAGFGSEGTCESLSFLAGTGEVSMNGAVKIQVKDKLGRVESELTTDTVKYKLDASALPGVLKP